MNLNDVTATLQCEFCANSMGLTRGEKWTTPAGGIDIDAWVADATPDGWIETSDDKTMCPNHPRAV